MNIVLEKGDKSLTLGGNVTLSDTEKSDLKDIKVTVHGSLKKPIMAMNLLDLMEDLQMLRENPDDYLSPTPLFYSCFPLSAFLKDTLVRNF